MNTLFKSFLRGLLDRAGLELRKTRAAAGKFTSDPFMAQKEFIRRLGVSTPVILDVGAHKGETVCRYRTLFPDAVIHCFEPFPGNAESLRRRFSSDSLIHVHECAMSDVTGRKTFYLNENSATNSLLPREKNERRYYSKAADSCGSLEVDTLSIDDFMQKENIEHIDIVKFDIQGGELMALTGASDTLEGSRISLIYTETLFVPHYEDNPLLLDLWKYLDEYGYSFFDIYDLFRAANGQLRFADTLFISSETREKVLNSFVEEP